MAWQRKADAPYVIVTDAAWWTAILIRFPFLQYLSPALGGETIDLATFCAAGPEWVPPITMADIVWVGLPEDMSRPHVLFTVVRAIGRQEAFAKYCENPDDASAQWRLWEDHLLVYRDAETWENVCYASSAPFPTGTTYQRITLWGGIQGKLRPFWSASPAIEQESYDSAANAAIARGGLGTAPLYAGAPVEVNIAGMMSSGYTHLALSSAQGNPPALHSVWEISVEIFAPGTGAYDAGAVYQDPNVVLPDGSGATVDQLEVKLDVIQQLLRRTEGNLFNLDPTSMSGVNSVVVGDLLDAVGLLVTVVGRPSTRSSWSSDPSRYPALGRLTIGNADGWWTSTDIEHDQTVVLPLPPGATRYAVTCQPPMQASVTLYRPTS